MGRRWLLKSEPSEYAWDELVAAGQTVWDGVTNALALQNLRTFAKGDPLLFYHTGRVKAVVGLARVTASPRPDPQSANPKLVVVDIEPTRALARPVSLAEIKSDRAFSGFELLRLPRLSVVPVSDAHWKRVVELGAVASD